MEPARRVHGALDLTALAALPVTSVGQLHVVAHLAEALGPRREDFMGALDLTALAALPVTSVNQLHAVAQLIEALGDRQGEFTEALDLTALAFCPSPHSATCTRWPTWPKRWATGKESSPRP